METALFKKDDQVIFRHQIRGGTAVDFGSIVRIEADGKNALVNFPTLYKNRVVSLNDLQNTGEIFGGVRVHRSPAKRTIRTFIP